MNKSNTTKSVIHKENLIKTMEMLIESEHSIHSLTISDITLKAGLSRPMFYKFYADKFDLLRSCFLKIQESIADQDGFWQKIEKHSTQEDIRNVINEIAMAYHKHKILLVAVRDVSRTDKATRKMFVKMVEWRACKLKNHIETGQAEGWINPKLIPHETAMLLTSTGFRSFEQTVGIGSCTLDDFVNAYTNYVTKILYSSAKYH